MKNNELQKVKLKFAKKLQIFCEDMPDYMLHEPLCRKKLGVYFGTKTSFGITNIVSKPLSIDGHAVFLGGTGAGKSSCNAIPTILNCREPFVVLDVNGELEEQYEKLKRSSKRPHKVINLNKGQINPFGYDPFTWIKQQGEEDLAPNCNELAQALIPLPPNDRDPFWIMSAQGILTSLLIYCIGEGKSFNETMQYIVKIPLISLFFLIGCSDNQLAKAYISQFLAQKKLDDSKMLLAIDAILRNKLIPFATDTALMAAFESSKDSVTWDDLETHNIFIRVDQARLERVTTESNESSEWTKRVFRIKKRA